MVLHASNTRVEIRPKMTRMAIEIKCHSLQAIQNSADNA
jgi:hypothetical protein